MTKTTRALVKTTETVSLEDFFNHFFDLGTKLELGDDALIVMCRNSLILISMICISGIRFDFLVNLYGFRSSLPLQGSAPKDQMPHGSPRLLPGHANLGEGLADSLPLHFHNDSLKFDNSHVGRINYIMKGMNECIELVSYDHQ